MIASVLHFAVTDIVVKASHSVVLLPVAIVYLVYNYHVVKTNGTPVYWFLTWEDSSSLLIGAGLTLACVAFFCSMSFFSKFVRIFRYSTKETNARAL